ncbi:MAG: hypothetical protein KJZ86_07105 [Caldilineaceae bacterium]|nr:hypothetical protein [Caldilineaceae bacterium]
MSEPIIYHSRPVYRYLALLGLGVALLFAWELGQSFAWPTIFFLGIALAFAATYSRWAADRVELTPTGLAVYRLFSPPTPIDFRQIASIEEAGRMTTGLTLVYFPLNDRQMIDLDGPRSLFLPGLKAQKELLAIIQAQMVD